MYRVSPFTYWVAAMAAAMLHDRQVTCSDTEISVFQPPATQTCGEYMAAYLTQAPGQLQNPDATSDCAYCSIRVADTFLEGVGITWGDRWRNFGLVWVYVIFNIFAAVFLYYFFRVRTHSKKSKSKKSKKGGEEKKSNVQDETKPQEGTEKTERSQSSTSTTRASGGVMQRSLSTAQNVGANYLTYNLGRTKTNERNAHII